MIRLLLIVSVFCNVYCNRPIIFAAPSAVSHQSRIDIKHTPGFISAPLIYSPATTIYASHPNAEVPREAILAPVLTTDTLLTPIALSFFHNLPLARALEHPISIDKAQEPCDNHEVVATEKENVEVSREKEKENVIVTKFTENLNGEEHQQNYGSVLTNNNSGSNESGQDMK